MKWICAKSENTRADFSTLTICSAVKNHKNFQKERKNKQKKKIEYKQNGLGKGK